MDSVECELCGQQAFLYCPSDSAFLCWHCDGEVHSANFLVARHVRHRLSEAGSGSADDSSSSSSATGKIKKTDSYSSSLTQLSRDQPPSRESNKRKREEEGLPRRVVEGIFVNWSRGFGVAESRLARGVGVGRGTQDLKEGWAES